jgi:hypothetical protein
VLCFYRSFADVGELYDNHAKLRLHRGADLKYPGMADAVRLKETSNEISAPHGVAVDDTDDIKDIHDARKRIEELERKIQELEKRFPQRFPDVKFLNYRARKRILVS